MTEPRPTAAARIGKPELGGVSFFRIAAALLRERTRIAIVCGIGVLLTLTIALTRPKLYSSTFSFLPQVSQDGRAAGLASLAGQFGISLSGQGGLTDSPQLYADLLSTRTLLTPIASAAVPIGPDSTKRVPLAAFLGITKGAAPEIIDKTLQTIRGKVLSATVATHTTGLVSVAVRTRSPYVSLAIARRLLEGVNRFNLTTRQSEARDERIFTEGRLADARDSLRSAEDALQRFLQSNRQLGGSPALEFERDRLQREVSLRQQVVVSLAQQYEENRIREVRDTPVLTVIEPPSLPSHPDARHLVVILALGAVGSFAVAIGVVLIRETWQPPAGVDDPDRALLSAEWKRVRGRAAS